jgi:amino acid transporter
MLQVREDAIGLDAAAVTALLLVALAPLSPHWNQLLWVLAALLFLIPLAIATATLTAKHPQAGGLYIWTRSDFGPWHGFLAFWVYWMGIAVWFPSAAMFYVSIAGSALVLTPTTVTKACCGHRRRIFPAASSAAERCRDVPPAR